MPFMSKLMADVYWLLQMNQSRTSVYHPQTDKLAERFNQTMKRMLWHLVKEDGRNWDLFLSYVLFVVRETP